MRVDCLPGDEAGRLTSQAGIFAPARSITRSNLRRLAGSQSTILLCFTTSAQQLVAQTSQGIKPRRMAPNLSELPARRPRRQRLRKDRPPVRIQCGEQGMAERRVLVG